MLFVAFPDSTSSSRLMVIVLLRGGGSLGAGGFAGVSGEAVEAGPVKTVLGADSARAAPVGVDSVGVVGAGSSAPIAGGSEESAGGSCDGRVDRKSTRLNSSHRCISYAVFCLKKKKKS